MRPEHETEQETEMAEFAGVYLRMIALKFGGDTTLNEIRVMNFVFRNHLLANDIGVVCISTELGIPKSTVSRSVLNLRLAGWVREEASSDDARRRYLRPTEKMLRSYKVTRPLLEQRWPNAA